MGAAGPTVFMFWLRAWSSVNGNLSLCGLRLNRGGGKRVVSTRPVSWTWPYLARIYRAPIPRTLASPPAASRHVPIIRTAIIHSVTSHFRHTLVWKFWLQCLLVGLGVVLLSLLSSCSTLLFSYNHHYNHHQRITKIMPSPCRWRDKFCVYHPEVFTDTRKLKLYQSNTTFLHLFYYTVLRDMFRLF
jgi:hypothetical protein